MAQGIPHIREVLLRPLAVPTLADPLSIQGQINQLLVDNPTFGFLGVDDISGFVRVILGRYEDLP